MRVVAWPTVLRGLSGFSAAASTRTILATLVVISDGPGGGESGFDVAVVVGAAADVAGHGGAHFIARGMRMLRQAGFRAHQLARGAVSALRGVVIHEGLLQRVELPVVFEAFDGLNGLAVHPRGQMAAGIDRLAIEQHGAGAALAAVATDLGAGEVEMIAQSFGEGPAVFDFDGLRLAVDGQVNGGSRNGRVTGGLRGDLGSRGRDERGAGSTDKSTPGNLFASFGPAHTPSHGMDRNRSLPYCHKKGSAQRHE